MSSQNLSVFLHDIHWCILKEVINEHSFVESQILSTVMIILRSQMLNTMENKKVGKGKEN